jgi:hypothetical protein
MKVLLSNSSFFDLSLEAKEEFCKRKSIEYRVEIEEPFSFLYYLDSGKLIDFSKFRTDSILIELVEELQEKANTSFSVLKVINIPDDIEFVIQSCEEHEWIAEKHRTWTW